jgi:hypothetical protein
MADSESPEGVFQSLIQVRISSTERQACEMVKEAIQLAIQEALGDEASRDPRSHGISAAAPSKSMNPCTL